MVYQQMISCAAGLLARTRTQRCHDAVVTKAFRECHAGYEEHGRWDFAGYGTAALLPMGTDHAASILIRR